MKKINWLQLLFLLAISFALQVVFHEIWYYFFHKKEIKTIENEKGEYFDPSLMRLSTISKLIQYCDSVYGGSEINNADTGRYSAIVSFILRQRFFHGYSKYRLGQNFIAHILAPAINDDLNAIVIPDDILKHPNGACSQQSIIGMEVFKRKGFSVRKVGFSNRKYGGHFCFEVYYTGKWHFFDPDLEPELSTLIKLDRPSLEELRSDPQLLDELYSRLDFNYLGDPETEFFYGEVNTFPAAKARVYQFGTKFLSYTLWLWLILLYYFIRKKLNQIKKEK